MRGSRRPRADAGDAGGGERRSLTTLREELVKIGAEVVSHGRYATCGMAEVAVPRRLFTEALRPIARPRAPPTPA